MTLRHIEIFRALCQNDYNTTKTAQALNMTQPAISLAIKELEAYYNIALFDRIGRRLVITMAGRRFEEYTNSIETMFEDMEQEMKNWDNSGTIRVGASLTIGSKFLPLYVKKFRETHPETKVTAFIGPASILEKKILDNQLDFALSEGIAHDTSILSRPYMDDRLATFCNAEGPYRQNQRISRGEFCKNTLILREEGSGTRKVFDLACEKAGFRAAADWESMSNTAVIKSVMQGLGVGVVSYRLIESYVLSGMLNAFEVEGLDLGRKFYIIHHKDKKPSKAARMFIDICSNSTFDVSDSI